MVSAEKVCRSKYAPNTVLIENIPTRFCWLIYRKQKLVQSKILKQEILVLILPCHAKQVLMSILCILFYLVSEEFSFSATSSIRPGKSPFMTTNNWIVLAAWWSPWYSWKFVVNGKKMEKVNKFKTFCFSTKSNWF